MRAMDVIIFNEISRSVDETERLGAKLAELFKSSDLPRFVALDGDLGAGKTAFARGFCSVFCPNAKVKSPSFAIVNEYRGDTDVYHFDVWRITDGDDLYSTGFYDYSDRRGIIVCEWAENIKYALPDAYVSVEISKIEDDARRIVCKLIK